MDSNQRQFAKMLLTTQNTPKLEYNEENGACRFKHSYFQVYVSFNDMANTVELSTNIYKFVPKSLRPYQEETDEDDDDDNNNNNSTSDEGTNNNSNTNEGENNSNKSLGNNDSDLNIRVPSGSWHGSQDDDDDDDEVPPRDEIVEYIREARNAVLDLRDEDDGFNEAHPELAARIQWDPDRVRLEWYDEQTHEDDMVNPDFVHQVVFHQAWPLAVLYHEIDFQDMILKFVQLYYATRNRVIDYQTGQPIEEMKIHRFWLINKRMSWFYKRRQKAKRRALIKQEREERRQKRIDEALARGEKLEDLELGTPKKTKTIGKDEEGEENHGWFFSSWFGGGRSPRQEDHEDDPYGDILNISNKSGKDKYLGGSGHSQGGFGDSPHNDPDYLVKA